MAVARWSANRWCFVRSKCKATSILLQWKPQLEWICHLALGRKQSTQSQEPLQPTHWEHHDMITHTGFVPLISCSLDLKMPSLGLKMHWSKSSVKSSDSNRSLHLHPATFEYQLQSSALSPFSRLLWVLSLRGETDTWLLNPKSAQFQSTLRNAGLVKILKL